MLCSVNTRIHTTLYPAVFTRNFRTPFKSTYIRNSRPFHVHIHVSEIPDLFTTTDMYQKFPDPFHVHIYQKFQTLFTTTCIRNSRPPSTSTSIRNSTTPFTSICIRNSRPFSHVYQKNCIVSVEGK